MTTQPTQDAVPSESPRDLKFNAGKIDEFATSMGWTYTDRFGVKHYTIEGINYLAQQAMNAFGYVILTGKTFTTGATINNPNEVLLNTADGEYYKWTGSFASGPKVVPASSTPAGSGGIGPGAWIGVGDSSLRAALVANDGEKFIGECQTIAMLRAIEPTYDKQRITLREHTAGTGKGGGQFRSVLAGSSYTDNNGTIIKTAGGAAWLRINADITNPLMFGAQAAVGVDDSSAINAAIAATSAECDGLGYGYQIASTVAINQPNKRFRKARLSLTSTAAVSTVMFRIRANYAEVIECIFDGNGGANTNAAIIWEGALCQVGGVVRNCQFLYCGANGISVTPDYANGLFNNGGVIQDCFFQTCGSTNPNDNRRCSILADGVSNFRIQGCDIRKSNWGIYVRQDTGQAGRPRKSGNKILDCHVEGSGRTHATYTVAQGLSANRQDGMIVNNVRVHDFADNGFDFGSSHDCQISNAYFNSCKDAIFIGDISCERYNISNVIAESCDRGLRVVMDGTIYPTETAQQIRISNMQVFDPNYTGFFIVNTGATTVVKDIELVNCSVDSTNSYSLSTYT
ncbi:right-handed parallel beta-helix repeat-containing protein [Enterobacter soli]|uniref:tail fiber/spike domain-containing protein n=1 Tax=Enterobacter soli TaxID=885040 RepID=UPI00325A71CC